ncbi:hypothetical protein DMUE_0546, partial [Dictyocoela muelleri]
VQIDETAICRGQIITNPSSTNDNTPIIQWLIGGIEDTDERRFFLEIILNRSIETISNALRNNLHEGTVIITDGYPSYPNAVTQFGSQHIIVPHNQVFTNSDGNHTNLFENLWSNLKAEYRIRRGIPIRSMEDFIFRVLL